MKIAIAGYGVEGQASYRYWHTADNQITIIDEKQPADTPPIDATVIVDGEAYAHLAGYDMVVRTPGLAPRKIVTDGKIWSATNEFFARCPAPIIGVTGSKGKGTTCSLIASILRAAGKNVYLVGNIGVPALDVLADVRPDDIVVYELSSFQLWDAERSPHVAVVLMIEPDHLDVHANMDEYVDAKSNIVRFQAADDITVFNTQSTYSQSIAGLTNGHKIGYQTPETAHVRDRVFWYGEQKLCSVEESLKLPGQHNQDNACAAIAAVWPWVQNGAVIAEGMASFTGLPHRLNLVGTQNDVRYYDDSIATTPGSAIAAIQAFTQPKVLIVGGSDKGAEYTTLVDEIIKSSMRAVLAIGQQGPKIAQLLRDRGATMAVQVEVDEDMQTIVANASTYAQPGDVVILSPACASFDMFKNYADRGDQFIAAVKRLA